MQDQNERKDKDGGGSGSRWGRLSRTASFWILVLLIPILLLRVFSPPGEDASDFHYSQFMSQVRAGNVAEVTVIDGKRVKGELRRSITVNGTEVRNFKAQLPMEHSERVLASLEEHDIVIRAEESQNWGAVLMWLPWILLIGIWLFFIRQMQAGGSKAFQFGKSRAKLISPDTPKVTFADVAGADEAKAELEEIIEFLRDPQRFSRVGGRLPKGVLLVGPPGTGKTLLAKAVAGEAERPFFSMSGSDFVEMFVGVGASRVRDLFEQAKANAPCIVFIDEIDAVGRHRGAGLGGGHDEREQTLNQLLVEMDGFGSNEGIILIAATNRPDVLDPALLRPGRFDRQVVVDSPDVRGREAILKVHLAKIPLSDDVDVTQIAKGTPGMSGADLANIVNEAALLAARRNQDRVAMRDLDEAKDKIMLGAERRSMVLSEAERKLTAYHEAGHAVVALRTPGLDPVHKITIVPRGRALGVTASLPEEDRHSYSRDYLLSRLAMLFGGRAAEEMIFGPEKITTGAGNDIERATSLARRMVATYGMSNAVGPMAVGDSEQEVFIGRELVQRREISERTAELVDAEVKRILDEAYEQALSCLRQNEDLLAAIAEALLERETLDRSEVELLAQGQELPPPPEDSALAHPLAAGGDPAGDTPAAEGAAALENAAGRAAGAHLGGEAPPETPATGGDSGEMVPALGNAEEEESASDGGRPADLPRARTGSDRR